MAEFNSHLPADRRLCFDDFELDGQSGELRRSGRRVKLAQQPFRLLWLLASRAGEMVSREEIRQHLWDPETHVDFERGLNFSVLRIRRALGDDARSPRFIETLPRRGYRLITPVEALETNQSTVVKIDQPRVATTSPGQRRVAWRWHWAAAFGFLLAVTLIGAMWLWPPSRPPVHEPAAYSERLILAVLPFKNLSADPSQDYFSDGLTEEMIAQLGGLNPGRLGVIARTTMERFKDTTRDVGDIGRELDVDYILEGSVRRDGEAIRITAQLIVVVDQTHLWARSYNRNKWGALVVQREVGREVAESLRLELLPDERSLPDRAGGHKPAAHDAYLMGRYLQRSHSSEELLRSVDYFQRAIEIDPDFALPRAALAESYHHLALAGALPPRESYPLAREAAWIALARDPQLAEAHLAIGRVAFWHDWDWLLAEQHLGRALELNPSSAEAHHEYGWFLVAMGRTESGLEQLAAARELDPLSASINVDAGWALVKARRYDQALEQCQRSLELEPGNEEARFCLEWITMFTGEGRATEKIRRRLDELLAQEQASPHTLAAHFVLLEEYDEALRRLEAAFERRQPSMALLAVDPIFDALRDDPRFAALIERLDLGHVHVAER